jgi:hypothetical protein
MGKLYGNKNVSGNHLIFKLWGGGVLYSKDSGAEVEFVKVRFSRKKGKQCKAVTEHGTVADAFVL